MYSGIARRFLGRSWYPNEDNRADCAHLGSRRCANGAPFRFSSNPHDAGFLFSARNSNCLPPITEHPQRYRTKKRARVRTRLGGACITSAQCICREPYPSLRELPFLQLLFFRTNLRRLSPPCTRARQSGSPQATSSNRLISRNGLQQAAWRCSQSHRRRTIRRAPRYQCSRD